MVIEISKSPFGFFLFFFFIKRKDKIKTRKETYKMYQIIEHKAHTVVLQHIETMSIIEVTYDEVDNYTIMS